MLWRPNPFTFRQTAPSFGLEGAERPQQVSSPLVAGGRSHPSRSPVTRTWRSSSEGPGYRVHSRASDTRTPSGHPSILRPREGPGRLAGAALSQAVAGQCVERGPALSASAAPQLCPESRGSLAVGLRESHTGRRCSMGRPRLADGPGREP